MIFCLMSETFDGQQMDFVEHELDFKFDQIKVFWVYELIY